MKLQKILFVATSIILLVFIAEYLNLDSSCVSSSCSNSYNSILLGWFLMSAMTITITLLLLRSRAEVVDAWWEFARIAIPLILIISTLINLGFHHNSGGFMNMDDMFDIPVHILLYTIFVVGSIVQIVRGLKSSD
jgi:hypothetical protein